MQKPVAELTIRVTKTDGVDSEADLHIHGDAIEIEQALCALLQNRPEFAQLVMGAVLNGLLKTMNVQNVEKLHTKKSENNHDQLN
jgi:hypothetical protein